MTSVEADATTLHSYIGSRQTGSDVARAFASAGVPDTSAASARERSTRARVLPSRGGSTAGGVPRPVKKALIALDDLGRVSASTAGDLRLDIAQARGMTSDRG